jgi:hypothetical protein
MESNNWKPTIFFLTHYIQGKKLTSPFFYGQYVVLECFSTTNPNKNHNKTQFKFDRIKNKYTNK